MSVLIRGLKMPTSCIDCFAQFGGFCYIQPAWVDDARVAPTVDEAWEQRMPKWCPLIELPDHGDLIIKDGEIVEKID